MEVKTFILVFTRPEEEGTIRLYCKALTRACAINKVRQYLVSTRGKAWYETSLVSCEILVTK